VFISNEDYDDRGGATKAEKQAWLKIYREALEEKRDAGSVCVYLVSPDGDGFDSLIVSAACEEGRLAKMLASAVDRYKVPAGKPVVAPRSQSAAPKAEPSSLVLHLVSRIDHRYSWGEFPAENWIVLAPDDVKAFAPPRVEVGANWTIDERTAAKILTHFYPQTETCNHAKDTLPDGGHQHRIVRQSLTSAVIAVREGIARVRLTGDVRLKHTFYPNKDDDNQAEAKAIGYVDVDVKSGGVRLLRLATHGGTYGKHGFAVAVQSVEVGQGVINSRNAEK
jgi:hypothetical protein